MNTENKFSVPQKLKFLKGKKAISGVVVAILILLIAVIAVSIFWFALRPAIEKSTIGIGKGQECLALNLKITSADAATDNLKVFREAGVAPLIGIKVIVNGQEATGSPFPNYPLELETENYPVTLATNDVVEIAGILEGDIICSIADTATVA